MDILSFADGLSADAGSPDTSHPITKRMIHDMIRMPESAYNSTSSYTSTMSRLARKYKKMVSKRELGDAYRLLNSEYPDKYPVIPTLQHALMIRAVRSASGILNVSVVMPPDTFSCKYNCKFCPNETRANGASVDMPRSYLSNEDAVKRAASVGFDAVRQVYIRLRALEVNGHPLDKIEFRVLGGTFSCYAHDIADAFIRDLYYAANTYTEDGRGDERPRLSISEEQERNVHARIHVVGLGIETRPDEISMAEIARLRRYGVTRVELGVQHTNDDLLRRLNRGHGMRASKRAIRRLKDAGFKIEMHIMTDLPGTTPELDKACYDAVLRDDPDLIPDYMKDYPCLDVAFTEIKKWKADGTWTPYAERDGGRALKDVLIYRQSITPPWVRVNRVQRDFHPADESNDFLGFTSDTLMSNLAQIVKDEAEARGVFCKCIRCCEVRGESFAPEDIQYKTFTFTASGATEHFIAAMIDREPRHLMLGFIRLRLSGATGSVVVEDEGSASVLPELAGHTAMIRELHVYGQVRPAGEAAESGSAQHLGIGRRLLALAESAAREAGYEEIAVISGIGVRDYYRKNGYELRGSYMMKSLAAAVTAAATTATTAATTAATTTTANKSGFPTFILVLLYIVLLLNIIRIAMQFAMRF
jgi:ELP3 family radical SAM enzyme/protein acetyltransferase